MKKILFSLIVILALILRLYKIGGYPATLYGDEQTNAWNAFNILKTGQDEYGNQWPLQFRSFDDYKPPLPVYTLVPFIHILGLNSFAIRLPVVIFSVLTVITIYFLSRIFFDKRLSLIIMFLLAVSPWHVHLSRGFFEATMSLLFFLLGVLFLISHDLKLRRFILSMIFFSLSTYTYFSARILVPLFLVFSLSYVYFYHDRSIGKKSSLIKYYLVSFVCFFFLSLPIIKLTLFDKGFSRFENLAKSRNVVISDQVNRERHASNLPIGWRQLLHNKPILWIREIKQRYLEHLSFNFLYIYGDNSLRYFTGNMGMFYLVEMPFFIIGLYQMWKEKKTITVFFMGWMLLAPIPASLVGRSFALRSMSMLPAPLIFAGYGLYKVYDWFKKGKLLIFSIIMSLGYILALGSLMIRYYLEYPVYAATWWGWENKAAIDYASEREDEYEQIFISDFYTGSTLAFAVYKGIDPFEYRKAVNNPVTLADGRHLIRLGKYYFGSLDIDKERLDKGIIPPRSLYIGRPEEADSDELIRAPDDGRIIFKVYKTN